MRMLTPRLFICYVKNFVCGEFRMKRYHYDFELCFYYQQTKSEKKNRTRNSTLQNTFSSMLL